MIVIRKYKLGLDADNIDTHYIRSGAAIEMNLEKLHVYNINIIGRCSSDVCPHYIIKYKQFSHYVSARMIKNQNFTHIPNFQTHKFTQDPKVRNHHKNFVTRCYMRGVNPFILTPSLIYLWNYRGIWGGGGKPLSKKPLNGQDNL